MFGAIICFLAYKVDVALHGKYTIARYAMLGFSALYKMKKHFSLLVIHNDQDFFKYSPPTVCKKLPMVQTEYITLVSDVCGYYCSIFSENPLQLLIILVEANFLSSCKHFQKNFFKDLFCLQRNIYIFQTILRQ